WAWELITEVWKLDKNRLYATVYLDDDEAEDIWLNKTDIDSKRISRLGKKDNFWEMGETGPCGPCSEIHYDIRDDISEFKTFSELENDGLAVELWNLVFIQYNRMQDQSLEDLPAKHVDTGMGFERITAVLQGKTSNYDTDIFQPTIKEIEAITGMPYVQDSKEGIAFRVLADHIRALTFAIADGALPSNEGRGYVLRRILRRAARYGREMGILDPFIFRLVLPVVETLGDHYPEIKEKSEYIATVIRSEEESFGKTLDRGLELFNIVADDAAKTKNNLIRGEDAFKLYDTFGFPLDLTELMARERGLRVESDGFDKEMSAQKIRSQVKKTMPSIDKVKGADIKTEFTFDKTELSTTVAGIFDSDWNVLEKAEKGDRIFIQLSELTPFYAESGGQIGDHGVLQSDDGSALIEIDDTQKSTDKTVFHHGIVKKGSVKRNDSIKAAIDIKHRELIKKNHTATHLLHKALRDVLGDHVMQAGSLVAPDYLRFDFNHFKKMTTNELFRVEKQVNSAIRKNIIVKPLYDVPFDEAKKMGAMALFGEKYGEHVRVVSIGDHSRELCGGTHVNETGEIGEFRLVSESAAAAGVRRIVAETGEKAEQRTQNERELLLTIREMLNASNNEIAVKLSQLIQEKKNIEKILKDTRRDSSKTELDSLIRKAMESGPVPLFTHEFNAASVDELKDAGDVIRGKMQNGAAMLGAQIDGKAMLVCVVGDTLMTEKKWKAGELVKEVARSVGGGGGGKPHMATAGIKDTGKLSEALGNFAEIANALYGENI
ncbi:alanine--tRNA ligase, partial [candidate division KSB1 bacterium]